MTEHIYIPVTLPFLLKWSKDTKESDHVNLVNEELGLEFRYYAPTCRDLDWMTRDVSAKVLPHLAGRYKASLIQTNDYEAFMRLNQERNELSVYLFAHNPNEWQSGRFSSPEKCAIYLLEKERNRFWNRLKAAILRGRKKPAKEGP